MRILVLGMMLSLAQPASATTDPKAAVLMAQARIDDALLANNPEALAPLLTDDATRTPPNGHLSTRKAWLASMQTGALHYNSVKRTDAEVRIFGNTAIVTGVVEISTTKPTGLQSQRNRYLRLFVKQRGKWLLAAHQATAID